MLEYKYKVGNYVKFKPTSELKERAGTVAKITGFAPPYTEPHYYINRDKDEAFPETAFERFAKMADLRAAAGEDPEGATILYMALNS